MTAEDSCVFAFAAANLQRGAGEKKKCHGTAKMEMHQSTQPQPWKKKPDNNNNNKTSENRHLERKTMKLSALQRNSCNRWRRGREDVDVFRAAQRCCCCCCCWCDCMDALVCGGLGPERDASTRALSCHPQPSRMAAHPGRRGHTFIPSLCGGSKQNLLAPHSTLAQE